MRTLIAGDYNVTESDEIICVIWSWTSHHDGFDPIDHRLTWIKDESWLYFEVKNPAGTWVSMRVRNERFRPSNHKQAREMAVEFIGGTDG